MNFNYFMFVLISINQIVFNECYDYSFNEYDPDYNYRGYDRDYNRGYNLRNFNQERPGIEQDKPRIIRVKKGTRRVVTRVQTGITFGVMNTDSKIQANYTNPYDAGVAAATQVKIVGGFKALQEFVRGVNYVGDNSQEGDAVVEPNVSYPEIDPANAQDVRKRVSNYQQNGDGKRRRPAYREVEPGHWVANDY